MLKQVVAAFDRRDYQTAAQLLKPILKQNPDNQWAQFYWGQLQEVGGKPEQAEQIYRKILKSTTNVRLTNQVRQGIQRILETERNQRAAAIVAATTDPANTTLGCLILEPLDQDCKAVVAPGFARLMRLDNYTARLHLPSRAWRLYRAGPIGKLQVYQTALKDLNIPAFCVPLEAIAGISVVRVEQLSLIPCQGIQQQETQQVKVVGRNITEELQTLHYPLQEIQAWVNGLLPLFESVVDEGAWHQLVRKEKTQDYAQLLDLHLPQHNTILRLCDKFYQFPPEEVSNKINQNQAPTTVRIRWNQLIQKLKQNLPLIPVHNQFKHFAETSFDQDEFLKQIQPKIGLFRSGPSLWDPAFQLYSTLLFLKG
jgi:tetratricopeptide (TPR) repeat protein